MKTTLTVLKVIFLGTMLAAFTASTLYGKAEYAKKEGKTCVTCHVKMGSKELNDSGKCYEKNKSLKDCKLPAK